jgi:outer membrane protein assembly factor BamB
MMSTRQLVLMSVCSVALLLPGLSGIGADWPNWRGPDHTGISSETTTWSPEMVRGRAPKIVWESNVGIGYSTVSVSNGRLYTVGNRRVEAGGQTREIDTVYCLDAMTGKEIWRFSYPCAAGNDHYPGPKATPAIAGGRVYTLSDAGQLFCLDAETGGVRWKADVIDGMGVLRGHFGLSGSPYIEGDLVLLNLGSGGLAIDRHTGKQVWSSPQGPCSFSTPVVFERGGTKKIALFSAKKLQVVDVASGEVEGSLPWDTTANENSADPIVDGERIFISSAYGMGSALLEVTDEGLQVIWRNMEMNNVFTSSVLIDGHVYGYDGTTRRCSLKCIDLETGESKWSQKLDFGSLIAAGDRLLILTQKGTLYIATASPEGYKEITSARVLRVPASAPSQRGKHWWSAPVLVDGLLYARSHTGDLVCIDLRKRS